MNASSRLFVKIGLMAVLTLLMLIPLAMIKNQIRDRQEAMDASGAEVAASWAGAQAFGGPVLKIYHAVPFEDKGKILVDYQKKEVYPVQLRYEIVAETQTLHRSIYEIMVYRSTVRLSGSFRIPEQYQDDKDFSVELALGDLRGIEGDAVLTLDGKP